jgi:molybdopterin converting factor subunit 1
MPLAVRTLFFAAYRDLAGSSSLDLELPEGATVGDLVASLRARGGPLAELPPRPAVALNRSYARLEDRLHTGDEVALIPPVAGG